MVITIMVSDLLLMIITIMLIAQVRHTVRSSRIFDSDPVDIVPSTGMHKSCTASSIADLGDDHDDDDDDDNDHDEDFTQSKHRSEVFALMASFFSKWCGKRETERVTSNILQNCAQPPTWRNPNAIFLGKYEFFWKAELNSRDHFNNICAALNFSENIYTDLFDHVNKLYCNYTVSLSIKLG